MFLLYHKSPVSRGFDTVWPYIPNSNLNQKAHQELADAKLTLQQCRAAEPNRLGLDLLEANSLAAQARVQRTDAAKKTLTVAEKLALIEEEGKSVDRSNMSDKEVMEEIYARFSKYFSADEFPLYDFGPPFPGRNDMVMALSNEFSILRADGWTSEKFETARAEMFGYEGMTKDEIKQAVTEKYSSQGISVANVCRMLDEMAITGAMDDRTCRDIAWSISTSLRGKVEANSGYTRDYMCSDYENIMGKTLMEAFNAKTSVSSIFADVEFRITLGGWVDDAVRGHIYGFFNYLKNSGLY